MVKAAVIFHTTFSYFLILLYAIFERTRLVILCVIMNLPRITLNIKRLVPVECFTHFYEQAGPLISSDENVIDVTGGLLLYNQISLYFRYLP